MPCYHPIAGWKSKRPNDKGKYPLVFNPREGDSNEPVDIACGRCIGCRLEKSRQWAIRCLHEASLHEENSFITLTYDEDHLPDNGSLVLEDWQIFMKALRHSVAPKKIRHFMAGEYGENQDLTTTRTIGRPHYHAILFGHDFQDKELCKPGLYNSPTLDDLWSRGFTTIGDVTFESAAYVARYCMKKITGDEAFDYYTGINPYTGEIEPIKAEFSTQSSGGKDGTGIGGEWFKKYKNDIDKGWITVRGVKMPPPKYYHDLYAKLDEDRAIELARIRECQVTDFRHDPEKRADRLEIKEEVKRLRTKTLTRKLA